MIPKIIHFCWLSDDPYPKKIQKCINSWKKHLSDYKLILWNTKNFNIHCNKWVEQAFKCKDYAFVADYVRFYALYSMGGVYLDSDVEVLDSFDNLMQYKSFFGYEYTGLPEAAVLGAEKGCAWLKNALDWYESNQFLNADGNRNRVIAPLILKYAFEKEISFKLYDDEKPHTVEQNLILTFEFFSPKNGFLGMIYDSENTLCIHHFNSAWLKPGLFRKIKKAVHLALIITLRKKNYNKLMYAHRTHFKSLSK